METSSPFAFSTHARDKQKGGDVVNIAAFPALTRKRQGVLRNPIEIDGTSAITMMPMNSATM